jgi:hypothetical protein
MLARLYTVHNIKFSILIENYLMVDERLSVPYVEDELLDPTLPAHHPTISSAGGGRTCYSPVPTSTDASHARWRPFLYCPSYFITNSKTPR